MVTDRYLAAFADRRVMHVCVPLRNGNPELPGGVPHGLKKIYVTNDAVVIS